MMERQTTILGIGGHGQVLKQRPNGSAASDPGTTPPDGQQSPLSKRLAASLLFTNQLAQLGTTTKYGEHITSIVLGDDCSECGGYTWHEFRLLQSSPRVIARVCLDPGHG